MVDQHEALAITTELTDTDMHKHHSSLAALTEIFRKLGELLNSIKRLKFSPKAEISTFGMQGFGFWDVRVVVLRCIV
jgi:hypothetical protein